MLPIVKYKMLETLNHVKKNLWIMSNNLFNNYNHVLKYMSVLKKNYKSVFELINKVIKVTDKWDFSNYSFFLNKKENDNINIIYNYFIVETLLSLSRYYAENSISWWIQSNMMTIFNKNAFFEYDWDINKIILEFKNYNILIIDFNDIVWLSKNDTQKYFNIMKSLINTRNNLKVITFSIWQEDLLNDYEDLKKDYIFIINSSTYINNLVK